MCDEDTDDDTPEAVDVESSDNETSSDEEEYEGSEDDDKLHGLCNVQPVDCDKDIRDCFIGQYVAKPFEIGNTGVEELFTGVVTAYDQETKKFRVHYNDDTDLEYVGADICDMADLFEEWYADVSSEGRFYGREYACEIIRGAFKCRDEEKRAQPATAPAEIMPKTFAELKKMRVFDLRDLLQREKLDTEGLKPALVSRLSKHFGLHEQTTVPAVGKHKAVWKPKKIKVEPIPFSRQNFNAESLASNLPGWPDKMPSPLQCHRFFFTDEMLDLGCTQFNQYPHYLQSLQVRPPWANKKSTWPPKWTRTAHKLSNEQYIHNMYIMYLMGFKKLGNRDLRGLFSTNPMDRDPLLCELTTRIKLEKFLQQVHFEDSADPHGKKFPHSTNYRPNLVPKVGLLIEKFRRRCVLFCPEEDLSFDEATAKYGGRMTHMKHLQSKYKPYDGIRIYSLNGSKTGYTCNFRVDRRDRTSVEEMAQVIYPLAHLTLPDSHSLSQQEVFAPFKTYGYRVWADNAFVSVNQLKWCKDNGINFAGTSRTTYGFPKELVDDKASKATGKWTWRMAEPGLLAAFWSDVGLCKLMSNFHMPEEGHVFRRLSGQADKEKRTAPTAFVEYNDKMGGVDLKDFMRGLFTTQRRSKKWWKTLWYWCMDSSMYNGFCLYKWCYNQYHKQVCRMDFKRFIRLCLKQVFGSILTRTLVPTPPKGRYMPTKRALDLTGDDSPASDDSVTESTSPPDKKKPYTGPHKERQPAPSGFGCPGGELTPTELGSARRRKQKKCKYCLHAHGVRKDTTWVCSNCAQPVCLGCIYRYHVWVNQSETDC